MLPGYIAVMILVLFIIIPGIIHWIITIRYAAKVDDLTLEIEKLKEAAHTKDGE
jgi:hypothetical protein